MPTTPSLQLDDGSRLLHKLQRDLPTLSPKLGNVARFCIEHAATVCGTIPASVVRLAQRFGLKGFRDLKYALVDREAREAVADRGALDTSCDPTLIGPRLVRVSV